MNGSQAKGLSLARFSERLSTAESFVTLAQEHRRAAVAAVLRFVSSEPDVLLMRRAQRPGDRWSGQISMPGGHEDSTDDDLIETAVRETREEVGLDLARDADLLGNWTPHAGRARGRSVPLTITPFVFHLRSEQRPVPGEEAEEVFWFPLARALSGELDSTYAYEHEGQRWKLPCWDFEGRVIWGMTHSMLSELLRLVTG